MLDHASAAPPVTGAPGGMPVPADVAQGAALPLRPPPGHDRLPAFNRGWLTDGVRQPFLTYVPVEHQVNWSEELEELHDERSGRLHFIEVWTRRAMLARVGALPAPATVMDVGCSTGYLLADLRRQMPDATLIGVDLVAGGLHKAHVHVPDALLLQADACDLPLEDQCVDAVMCANLLEHVPDDVAALAEIFRTLCPGRRAVAVVPVGPQSYDCYDRLLGHVRRYARGELARKASSVGLRVLQEIHLGAPLYPAFWAVKRRNRLRYEHLEGDALERTVRSEIERTADSTIGHIACRLEELLLDGGVRLPFGIRALSVLERAESGA